MDKIEQYLVEYISSKLGVTEIKRDVDIFKESYMDSLGLFSLLIEINQKFNVEIKIEDLLELNSVSIANLANLISKKND